MTVPELSLTWKTSAATGDTGSAARSRPKARPSRESERTIRDLLRRRRNGRSLAILAQPPVHGGKQGRQLPAEEGGPAVGGVTQERGFHPEEGEGGLGGPAHGDRPREGG